MVSFPPRPVVGEGETKIPPRGPQTSPGAPKEAPRGRQERPRRLQEAPRGRRARPRRLEKEPKRPQEQLRRLQTLKDHTKRLQKNTIPKTIVHINVADIAKIDKNKKLLARGAVDKGRAGGGVPPWGRQSAARPAGAEHGVSDHRVAGAEVAKVAKSLAIVLCILLQIFFAGVF